MFTIDRGLSLNGPNGTDFASYFAAMSLLLYTKVFYFCLLILCPAMSTDSPVSPKEGKGSVVVFRGVSISGVLVHLHRDLYHLQTRIA